MLEDQNTAKFDDTEAQKYRSTVALNRHMLMLDTKRPALGILIARLLHAPSFKNSLKIAKIC